MKIEYLSLKEPWAEILLGLLLSICHLYMPKVWTLNRLITSRTSLVSMCSFETMNNENEDDPIDLSSNYSGAFRHASPTNDDLLQLTNQQGL